MLYSSESTVCQRRSCTSQNAGVATPEPPVIDEDDYVMADYGIQPITQMPGGGMHSFQVTTEPDAMDTGDTNVADRGVYRFHYQSIDQGTQTADLTGDIEVESMDPVALGGYSDIYKGVWRHRVSVDKLSSYATSVVGAVQHRRHFSYSVNQLQL